MNVKIFAEIFFMAWTAVLVYSIALVIWRGLVRQPIPTVAEIAAYSREFPALAGRWYFFSAAPCGGCANFE
jgi:hypothetical protein